MYKKIICLMLVCIMIAPNISYGNENLNEIPTSGKAAIVIDVKSGRVLYEKNIHEKLPMASTTKIMTALLAIENIPLDKTIKINPKAQGIEGSSIYLRANEKVKVIDLIYGLMLRSGNDAAEAIAYEVSGSIETFAELMNKRAKELGAKNTNFVNPHGLHNDNHYTTAYDLGLITKEALQNSTFNEVVKTKFWTADREGYKYFTNKNKSLELCEGADGVKTGYTTKSGRCLVTSATRNGMQLVSVTLNDYDWFNTNKTLLDESFNNYKPYTLFDTNQVVINRKVINGKDRKVSLKPYKSSVIPLSKGEQENLLTVIDIPKSLNAPIEKGQRIGKMITYLDNKIVDTTYLISDKSIQQETIKDKIKNFFGIN